MKRNLVLLAVGFIAFAGTYTATRLGTGRPLPAPARAHSPGMVWIPGGEFTMGSDSDWAWSDEKPAHRVRVDGFWMDATEVTNAQFREFVEARGCITTAEKAPAL